MITENYFSQNLSIAYSKAFRPSKSPPPFPRNAPDNFEADWL